MMHIPNVFPAWTDLVPPLPGQKISLNAQQDAVKSTVYHAFTYAYHHILFIGPFLPPAERINICLKWLVKGAQDARQPLVGARLRAQVQQYARPLMSLVCFPRIYSFLSHSSISQKLVPFFSVRVSGRQRSGLFRMCTISHLQVQSALHILK